MREISHITACFVDHGGLYLPLALKLAESYKRVLYHDPCEQAFPTVNRAVIGDGWQPSLERVENIWETKSETDLFIFPDSQGVGLQSELRSQGFPVWGSGAAETIEQDREKFHRILGAVGLEVPKFERVVGLSALRDYLLGKENKYIKISKYRGSLETCHFRSMDDDAGTLDEWAVKFGGVKEDIPFLVFDAIDTPLEPGGDTFSVRGMFPNHMLDGYEWKDKGYFAAWKKREEMSEPIQDILEAFGPVLAKAGHANFWSMEARVLPDGTFYFIDATPRGPLPGIGAQMEIITNLPTVIAAGAEGELVQPEAGAKFVSECVLTQKSDKNSWGSVRVPKELERWMKLGGACRVDGRVWFPPDEGHGEEIGWLVALGDTQEEAIETQLEQAKLLPDGVKANTESMVDLLKEIHEAEKAGLEFSEEPTPPPEIVVEEKP